MANKTDAPLCLRCPAGAMKLARVTKKISVFPELRSYVCPQCLGSSHSWSGWVEHAKFRLIMTATQRTFPKAAPQS